MLHPVIVHFAIAVPVVALVLQVLSLVKNSRELSKSAMNVLFFGALALIGAWFTGGVEGPEIYPFLSEEGQKLLIQHRDLGMGVGIGFAIITAIKIISFKKNSRLFEIVVTVLLFIGIAVNFAQGKIGGELVYQYGAGVECPEEEEDD